MSLYIHHVPGRLRVRTQSFRCQPDRAQIVARHLVGLAGVQAVTINPAAGSLTLRYDPKVCTQAELLAVLDDLGCVGARHLAATRTQESGQVAGLFGKALLGALAQTVAQRSVQTLVGVLR